MQIENFINQLDISKNINYIHTDKLEDIRSIIGYNYFVLIMEYARYSVINKIDIVNYTIETLKILEDTDITTYIYNYYKTMYNK